MIPQKSPKFVWATALLVCLASGLACRRSSPPVAAEPVCYDCFWKGYGTELRAKVADFYQQYQTKDPLAAADVRFIIWRAKNQPDCAVRSEYKRIAETDSDPMRQYVAGAVYAFSAADCGAQPDFKAVARLAQHAGLGVESKLLESAASSRFTPRFDRTEITTKLDVPPGAKRMVLGHSKIVVKMDTRIATQVERVARDWFSYQMKAKLDTRPLLDFPIPYHEGAVTRDISTISSASSFPITGTLIYRKDGQWYAPDEHGVFRFNVLDDKVQYPTTHVVGDFGFIEDTHGISALAAQALEENINVVIGCGDSEGKAEASFYLAQKGVNVIFPGDRYQDLLLGYTGAGTVLGTSPVRADGNKAIVGDQPIAFALDELIIVENTDRRFPIQYYDSGARYFKRLARSVPLKLEYVMVDNTDQIDIVLSAAQQKKSQAVAVRVMTDKEDASLRRWLKLSPKNRAILFHSGLYPYAQPLFRDFPNQVTFGDLRPQFE